MEAILVGCGETCRSRHFVSGPVMIRETDPTTDRISAPRYLQIHRLAGNDRFRLLDEIGERHGALVAFASDSYADGSGFLFLVAKDEEVGDLLHGEVADLGMH